MPDQPTTAGPVELTRGLFDAINSRDLDRALSFCATDAVYEAASLGTSFEGVVAIRGFLEDWLGAYDEHKLEPEEILDLGNGVAFVVVRLTARPVGSMGSGLLRRRPLAFLWLDGLVARITAYADSIEDGRASAERLAESRA
jgi:ketosteroid isomerase-like protein